jgi:3-isopropylmalate/(R)-2-methylmalate dehydratase large subunit
VRLRVRGALKPGVHARDVGFHLATRIANESLKLDLDYRVLEFAGDIEQFDLAARTALCSSPTEMGAYGVFFPPSEPIIALAKARAQHPFTPVYPDDDAGYEADLELDISALEPQIALPGGVHKAVDLFKVAGTPVSHAFIGSCGSGMYEDLVRAASILSGRRIDSGIRLFIAPGSERSTKRMIQDGIMQIFIEAGAVMLPAGCGPCNDAVIGPVHSGEASISTAANNNAGRFGATNAKLYLGSPATVAASAVAGRITDPRSIPASEEVLRLAQEAA